MLIWSTCIFHSQVKSHQTLNKPSVFSFPCMEQALLADYTSLAVVTCLSSKYINVKKLSLGKASFSLTRPSWDCPQIQFSIATIFSVFHSSFRFLVIEIYSDTSCGSYSWCLVRTLHHQPLILECSCSDFSCFATCILPSPENNLKYLFSYHFPI